MLFLNYYVSLVGNELTLIMIVEGFYFQKDFGHCTEKLSSLHAWLSFAPGRFSSLFTGNLLLIEHSIEIHVFISMQFLLLLF